MLASLAFIPFFGELIIIAFVGGIAYLILGNIVYWLNHRDDENDDDEEDQGT